MAAIIAEDGTGLANANCYCTEEEADYYHEELRFHNPAWTSAADKETALVWATRLLDEQVKWKGAISNTAQALGWPRSYVYTRDNVLIQGDTIPAWLKNATAELALYLVSEDRLAEAGTKGFEEIKLPGIKIKPDKRDRKSVIPKSVWSMIAPYGSKIGSKKRLVLG
jgi:hypothetical protein